MNEQSIFAGVIGIALFLAGMFFKDKFQKRQQVRDTVDAAAQDEQAGAASATQARDERIANAERKIQDEIDSRPVTDDPVADLADRIRRRKRRRRQRDG